MTNSNDDYQRQPTFPSVGGTPANPPLEPSPAPSPLAHDQPVMSEPVASTPVAASGGSGSSGRLRWVVAGVATVLVVVLLIGAFALFGSRPATPSLVAQYAPADAAAYLEVRYDLPGDQATNLAAFMSHFPGFADPAAFKQKVDETLSNALQRTGTGLDWETDVEPWFAGQIGLFTSTLAPTAGTPPSFTAVFSVKDRAKLDEVVNAQIAGSDFTQEDYKGQVIWSGNAADTDKRVSFAVTDEAFVVGTRSADVKGALDTKAGETSGLADDSFFTAQLGSMHADRLALFYLDGSSLSQLMVPTTSFDLPTSLPAGCTGMGSGMLGGFVTKILGEVRAENDHLAFNVRSQYPTGEGHPPAPGNSTTTLAQSMPSSTVAYAEVHQAGAQIGFLVEQLMKCMPSGEAGAPDLSSLGALLGVAPEDYFDFIQDAGVGVTLNDGNFGVGAVATVDDENVARTRIERLIAFLRLAGGAGGAGGAGAITVEEQQHGDATITVITLEGQNNFTGETDPAKPVKLGISVSNGHLYLGLDDFVTTALDQPAADSLANNSHLQAALAEAGTSNSGMFFVDVPQVIGFAESSMPVSDKQQFDSEVKPFLEPLAPFVVVTTNDNGINSGHGFLYVE